MKKENKAMIEMLICATLWSIAGIFMKLIPWNGMLGGLAIAGMRSFVAGSTFVVYMTLKKLRYRLNAKTAISGILTGCVYICFTCANKLTTAANAIVLQFTSPIFIVVLSAVFLKAKIKRADLMAVIFTLVGITLFFLDQLKPGYIFGNIVAILSGLLMAGMFMTVGNLQGEERFSAVLNGQIFTFFVGLPFLFIIKPDFAIVPVASIVILGVFQLGISYILYVKSADYCPPLACCLLGAVEPLLNPVWVFLFDGERPGTFALIGCAIVIITVTVWCIFGNSKEEVNA